MQLEDRNIRFCIGSRKTLDKILSVKSLPIFDKKILNFLDTLSKSLLSSQFIRSHPDIAAFAFWIRKKGMENVANKYQSDVLRFYQLKNLKQFVRIYVLSATDMMMR